MTNMASKAISHKEFKFLEYGVTGSIWTFRAIVDEPTRNIWYVGDEGQIMIHRMDREEWGMYLMTGHIALNTGNSDDWDEDRAWDNAAKVDIPGVEGNMDEGSKVHVIGGYLRKEWEGIFNRHVWEKVLNQYNRGLLTLADVSQQMLSL
jgi:hypothetical protein